MISETPIPEYLSLDEAYACFRPVAEVTLSEAVEMIDSAIRYCRAGDVPGILIDITRLTGFASPSTTERFFFIKKWVEAAEGKVVISMVAPAAMIDPHKIGVMIGANRGLVSEVFTDESEATAWLVKTM
ncbi:MAG: hypothetical protein ABJB40_05890 [Acidobacteriota bacterium]